MYSTRNRLLLSMLLLATATAGLAQTPAAPAAPGSTAREITAHRIPGDAPRIDGRLEEAVWAAEAPAIGFVQRQPHGGAPATQRTEAWVYHDDEAIYVGMRLHDSNPDLIAAPLLRRDGGADHSDWAYVMLDSNADGRTAYVFAVNPRGVQKDWFVADDSWEDFSWDAVWEVSAQMDSLGWTAEFRIPLSQLRFSPEQASWGINLGRWSARNREYSFWAPWLPTVPGYVSQFGTLTGLHGLSSPRRLELLPFAIGRLVRAPGDAQDPLHHPNTLRGSAGVDLRYGVTSNLTLTATLNPDFGQVEADPAVVNLTAFETRVSERRPFFVEGTSIFDFEGGEIFHSRRIGRAPQGRIPGSPQFRDVPEATTILGAAKLSGRTASGWSLGMLNALTAAGSGRYVSSDGELREAVVEPLTNYGVLRIARDLGGSRSTVGGILTSTHRWIRDEHLDVLPSSAWVGGLDGRHRFGSGGYELRGYLAGSRVEGSTAAIGRLQLHSSRYFQRQDAEHLSFDPDRTTLEGYAAGVDVAKIGGNWRWSATGAVESPAFEVNDLGFQHSADRISQSSRIQYRHFQPGTHFRSWDLSLSQLSDWTFGGERTDAGTTLSSNFEFSNYWSGYAQLMRRYSTTSPTALRGGPALHVPGFWRPVLNLRTDRRRPVSGQLFVNLRVGDAAGDRSLNLNPSIQVATPSLQLSLGPSLWSYAYPWQYVSQQTLDGDDRYLFGRLRRTEVSMRTRLNYTFAPRLSFELHAEPFVSAGSFDRFTEVADARAIHPEQRFHPLGFAEPELDPATNHYRVDLTGDGEPDLGFANPDFNIRSLRSNAVLRWEYRPGSTLFLVWSQGRQDLLHDGEFQLRDRLAGLLRAPGTHVLALKVSHWISP